VLKTDGGEQAAAGDDVTMTSQDRTDDVGDTCCWSSRHASTPWPSDSLFIEVAWPPHQPCTRSASAQHQTSTVKLRYLLALQLGHSKPHNQGRSREFLS